MAVPGGSGRVCEGGLGVAERGGFMKEPPRGLRALL